MMLKRQREKDNVYDNTNSTIHTLEIVSKTQTSYINIMHI